MGITCQILIKRPKDAVFRPGQSVTGVVKYAVDEATEYKDIVLSFFGKGKCSWTERKRNKTVRYRGTEEYFDHRRSLVEKKTNDLVLVDAGCYEYDFEFIVPDGIPSTYKDENCQIMYSLKLKFYRKQFFTSDNRFTTEIEVKSYVESDDSGGAIIFGLDKKLMKLFSSKKNAVNLKAQVNKGSFNPGDVAHLVYEVTNNTNIIIPEVKTELVEFKIYTDNGGHKKYVSNIIKECTVVMPSIPQNGIANLSNSITLRGDLYSIKNSKIFDREYKLKVTVKLPFPHLNTFTEATIIVGDQFHGEESNVDNDEPPSYWEAMLEEGDDEKKLLTFKEEDYDDGHKSDD